MNKQWLYDEYIVKDRSSEDIANEYGCKQNTIQCWLSKFDIKKPIKHHNIKRTKRYQNKDYLFDQIVAQQKSCAEVARLNNVSDDTIIKYCDKYNIPHKRKIYKIEFDENFNKTICEQYLNGTSINQISIEYDISRNIIKRAIVESGIQLRDSSESQLIMSNGTIDQRLYDAQWLEEQHWSCNRSCKDIAKELGVNPNCLRRHMHNVGIRTRTNSESKVGLMTGDKHPNWKGGITSLELLLREYFHTNLAPLAAKRDNYTCQICGKTHTTLNVHHIKPFADIVHEILSEHPELNPNDSDDKMKLYDIIVNDTRFLDLDNLVTLCKDCHIKIHSKEKDN